MESRNWMRLVAIGVFLAAIALGYVIYIQRSKTAQRVQVDQRPVVQISPTPEPLASNVTPTPTPSVLGDSSVGTTKGGLPATGIETLPKTGVPGALIFVFSISAAIAGYGLRKYPH